MLGLVEGQNVQDLIGLIAELKDKQLAVSPLAGGLTNHSYKLDDANCSYVLRLAGGNSESLGIDRLSEYDCARAAMEVGVGPDVLAFVPEHNLLLTRFVDGKVVTLDDCREPALMRRIICAVRHCHESAQTAGFFSPFATVANYLKLAQERGVSFPGGLNLALKRFSFIEQKLASNESVSKPLCLCHNDLLAANFIDDGQKITIIDWEYAGLGDRFFDLANLAANHQYDEADELRLLEFYFGEVCQQKLLRLRLMRLVSDMREAMWGFLQSGISSLDIDFAQYGQEHLERFLDGCKRLNVEQD
jgi:thiamine kinase-like enzyme